MLFNSFNSQEERKEYAGSAFLELQFCKLPEETSLEEKVDSKNIKNWKDDSLYVSYYKIFNLEYRDIFDCGFNSDLEKGIMDVYGINYYEKDVIDLLIKRINENKPKEYEVLVNWLIKAKEFNGFYIIGI